MVIASPGFHASSCIGQFEKPVLIEALVSQSTDEAFDKGVLDWLTGRDKPQVDSTGVGPLVERFPGEFRAVVQHQLLGSTTLTHNTLQHLDDTRTRE